eukprot:1331351-Amorphochlora_amoeboformis.AAC.1
MPKTNPKMLSVLEVQIWLRVNVRVRIRDRYRNGTNVKVVLLLLLKDSYHYSPLRSSYNPTSNPDGISILRQAFEVKILKANLRPSNSELCRRSRPSAHVW